MAVEHVAPDKTAVAGGVNALVRVVGGSLAGAVAAALLAAGDTAASFGVAAVAALLSALAAFSHRVLAHIPELMTKEPA